MRKNVLIITEKASGHPFYQISLALGFIDLHWNVTIFGDISDDACDRLIKFRKDKSCDPRRFLVKYNPYLDREPDQYGINYDDYDLVIVNVGSFFYKTANWENYSWLPNWLSEQKDKSKIVVTDFRDFSGRQKGIKPGENYGDERLKLFPYSLYCKREVNSDEWPDVLPLDIGAEISWNQQQHRDIFVSAIFSSSGGGGVNRGFRSKIAQSINYYFPNNSFTRKSEDQPLDWNNYLDILNRSQISVTYWGNGFSCIRSKEILSCGCLLAFKEEPNENLNEFVDGKNSIVYSDIHSLLEKLNDLYYNKEKVEKIRNNCWDTVINNKQHKHEASKIVAALNL